MANIEGVGPDAETVINEKGAKESKSLYRFDLLPPLALAEVAKVLAHGAEKYGEWNWLDLSPETNINHCMQHLFAYIAEDVQEGSKEAHLVHVACRILFAIDIIERNKTKNENKEKEEVHKESSYYKFQYIESCLCPKCKTVRETKKHTEKNINVVNAIREAHK